MKLLFGTCLCVLALFPVNLIHGKDCPEEKAAYDGCIERKSQGIFGNALAYLCTKEMDNAETDLLVLAQPYGSTTVEFTDLPSCDTIRSLLCGAMNGNCGGCEEQAETWKTCQWSDYREGCIIDCECSRRQYYYEKCFEREKDTNMTSCDECVSQAAVGTFPIDVDQENIINNSSNRCSENQASLCSKIINCAGCQACTSNAVRKLECELGCTDDALHNCESSSSSSGASDSPSEENPDSSSSGRNDSSSNLNDESSAGMNQKSLLKSRGPVRALLVLALIVCMVN